MLVLHCDPVYTERLAAFLDSLGQGSVVAGPDRVELVIETDDESTRAEVEIYLRVWAVIYPEAAVDVEAAVG
jgi:hypothetical protein